jgi:hypothetical protein
MVNGSKGLRGTFAMRPQRHDWGTPSQVALNET